MSLKTLLVLIALVVFFGNTAHAHLTDLARREYSFIPNGKSQDQYTRLRALLNYPLEIKIDTYLVPGAEYNRILLNLEDEYPFDTSELNKVHIIDLNLGYTFKWNEKWQFGFKFNPRIASTLSKSLTLDHFFLNGGVYVINNRLEEKTLKQPFRFILGLTYNATTGLPFPLPFVSYYRAINSFWSFNVGVPKSNIKYAINKKNNIQAFPALYGYLAHLQEPSVVNGQNVDNISLSVLVGGLDYEYLFTKHLLTYIYTGYTFKLNNVLRNKDRDNVFKLNDINTLLFKNRFKI